MVSKNVSCYSHPFIICIDDAAPLLLKHLVDLPSRPDGDKKPSVYNFMQRKTSVWALLLNHQVQEDP